MVNYRCFLKSLINCFCFIEKFIETFLFLVSSKNQNDICSLFSFFFLENLISIQNKRDRGIVFITFYSLIVFYQMKLVKNSSTNNLFICQLQIFLYIPTM